MRVTIQIPERRKPGRAEVQAEACPRCGAQPGTPCMGRRGPREANHIERVNALVRHYPAVFMAYGHPRREW